MPRKDSNLTELVGQLNLHSKNENSEKVLDLAKSILKEFPDERAAQHSMLVALIKLDRFREAWKIFTKTPELQEAFVTEYAYVLYKTEKIDELLKLSDRPEIGIQHALAQLLYKMEKFNDAHKIYQQLLKSAGIDVSDEFDIKINMGAIDAGRGEEHLNPDETLSYDGLFNAASTKLAGSHYLEALELLRKAKLSCESSGLSVDETREEVAPILTQAAYANQLLGKTDEALEILKNLKSEGINDKTLSKVVQNNILSLTAKISEGNPHILIAEMTDSADTSRETNFQKAVFSYNEVIARSAAGLDVVKRAKKQTKVTDVMPGVLSAAYLGKLALTPETFSSKAVKKGLEAEIKAGSDNISLQLLLSQAYYNDSKIEAATTVLENLIKSLKVPQKHYPGLVGILVSLYKEQNKEIKGYELIEAATEEWAKQHLDVSYAVSSLLKLDSFASTASNYFKKKYDAGDKNLSIIAGLIASSESAEGLDELYEKYSKNLGDIQSLVSGIDAQKLIEDGISSFLKKRKYTETVKNEFETQKKRRKPRLPKDFDPEKPVDPERWMPKRDRSTWKPKKKDKKTGIKNTQGGPVDNTTETVVQEALPKVAKAKNTPAKKKKKAKK